MANRLDPERMALRVAAELKSGQIVSWGAGLPSMVMPHVSAGRGVTFLSENGVLGYGARPERAHENREDLVDANGQPMNLVPGSASLDQADSFGIIRGGHLDVAVVEAMQVSQRGDLVDRSASLASLESLPPYVDVATGAKGLIAMMKHTADDGSPRIVKECSYSALIPGCVSLIVTDVAVIQVTNDGLVLKEVAPGWNQDEVRAITEAELTVAPDLKEMGFTQPNVQRVNKVFASAADAVADVPDGAVLLMDGFAGPGGMAQHLILALRDQGAKDLTMVSNTAGIARVASFGTPSGFIPIDHSLLVDNGQIRKAIASFPVSPSPSRPSSFELVYKRGEAELELVPQGTLAERLRAGGYGIGGFYTPTGSGTLMAEGKRTRVFDGKEYVLERGIKGDYALLRAHIADTTGNLVYKGTSRNFNAVMAPAAAITIVEVDEIVEPRELDPDAIVTPGIFVQRIVKRPADFSPYESI